MATRLNDKTLKKAISEIKSKGYTKKFWQEYRASAASGSGVAKAMTGLNKMGLPANGETKKLPVQDLQAIMSGIDDLIACLKKAQGKCKKGQEHTKKLCEAMIKHIKAESLAANKRVTNASAAISGEGMRLERLIQVKVYTVGANMAAMSDFIDNMEDLSEEKDANMKASIAKMKKLEKDWRKEYQNFWAKWTNSTLPLRDS